MRLGCAYLWVSKEFHKLAIGLLPVRARCAVGGSPNRLPRISHRSVAQRNISATRLETALLANMRSRKMNSRELQLMPHKKVEIED